MDNNELKTLALIFPIGIFDWFEIVKSSRDENDIKITFEEKNIPPLMEEDKNKKVATKGFTEITVTDFPIRGRRTLLTFRRRYWQVEGAEQYLKRDIQLCFPGTQLEQEFARFLKEAGGRDRGVARLYRPYALPPRKGI